MASAPDRIMAPPPGESAASKFAPHTEGTHVFVCVDIIDLGRKLDTYPGKAPTLVHKVAMVFASGERQEEDNSLVTVQQEFTLSTYETSKLRKFVSDWYGKVFTDEQLKDGFALHKLVGRPLLLTVGHKQSQKGRTYATVRSPSPLPKGMPALDASVLTDSYTRGEYWNKTKEEYAKEAAEFSRHQQTTAEHMEDPRDGQFVEEDDDSLPF
jgi:hypothetical protein